MQHGCREVKPDMSCKVVGVARQKFNHTHPGFIKPIQREESEGGILFGQDIVGIEAESLLGLAQGLFVLS